jgi:hypothetical protein
MGTADPELWCWECRDRITYKGTGRRPKYCSAACRQSAYARRKQQKITLTEARSWAPPLFELPPRPMSLDEIISVLRLLERKFVDDLVFHRAPTMRFVGGGIGEYVLAPGGAVVEDVHAAIGRLRAQIASATRRGIESHHHFED